MAISAWQQERWSRLGDYLSDSLRRLQHEPVEQQLLPALSATQFADFIEPLLADLLGPDHSKRELFGDLDDSLRHMRRSPHDAEQSFRRLNASVIDAILGRPRGYFWLASLLVSESSTTRAWIARFLGTLTDNQVGWQLDRIPTKKEIRSWIDRMQRGKVRMRPQFDEVRRHWNAGNDSVWRP